MISLIKASMSSSRKKLILIAVIVMAATVFLLSINAIYEGYCNIQIDNAYYYNGHWDVKYTSNQEADIGIPCIGTTENTYTAVLDVLNQDVGDITQLSNYMMSLVGIDDNADLTGIHLEYGKLPESTGEIVLPESFTYNHKSYLGGDYQVGDKVELTVGELLDYDGNIIQDDSTSADKIVKTKLMTYTITGFYDDTNYSTDNFISRAIVYKDSGSVHTYYYLLDGKENGTFNQNYSELLDSVSQDLTLNNYVSSAIHSVYETDFMKSVKNGIIVFNLILMFVAICIVSINVSLILDNMGRTIKQMYSLGASRFNVRRRIEIGFNSEFNSRRLYIPTTLNHLHGILEPLSRKIRAAFTKSVPLHDCC